MPLRSRILVVEDDDELRQAMAASLSLLGAEVEQARDGLEGLERLLCAGRRPGAILLDMRMPRLDGAGFLAAMRSQPALADIPVVTMSGGSPGHAGALAPGSDEPIDVEDLARILVSLCN